MRAGGLPGLHNLEGELNYLLCNFRSAMSCPLTRRTSSSQTDDGSQRSLRCPVQPVFTGSKGSGGP